MNAACCRPSSPQTPESYGACTHLQPPFDGSRQPPRAARHVSRGGQYRGSMCPALRARAGYGSAALGDQALGGLNVLAAHPAPYSSSPAPSRRTHTHLTSAPTKARGAAPDGGPWQSRECPRCCRLARTARPSTAHSFPLQRMLQKRGSWEMEEGE